MSGRASTRPSGSRWAATPRIGLRPLSSSEASCTSTRPSVTVTASSCAWSSRRCSSKRAGSGPAERSATQLPATPRPTRSTSAWAAWSRARSSDSWTTTSPAGSPAGAGAHGTGAVASTVAAVRAAARRAAAAADRATGPGVEAVEAGELGVRQGVAVLDGVEREQRLDRRQAPDPLAVTDQQRARMDDEPLRIRLRLAVVAVRQRGAQQRPAAVQRERGPPMGGRCGPGHVLVAEQGEGQAADARVALRVAEELLEDREHVAVQRRTQRLQGQGRALHAVHRGEDLRRGGMRGAWLPRHLARRGGSGNGRAGGGRRDLQGAAGLCGHVDARGPRAQVEDEIAQSPAARPPSPRAPPSTRDASRSASASRPPAAARGRAGARCRARTGRPRRRRGAGGPPRRALPDRTPGPRPPRRPTRDRTPGGRGASAARRRPARREPARRRRRPGGRAWS